MNQFVQLPCGKCGTTVWISPAAGVGYCPQCQTPNQLPPGAAQAAQQAAAPAYGASPQGAPGAYGAPPQGGYGAPPGGGFQAPAQGGFQAPPAGGYAPPPAQGGGYGAPPAGAPAGGYGAPPAAAPAPAVNPYGGAMQAPGGFTGMPMKAPGLPVGKIAGAVGAAIVLAGLGIGGNVVKDMLKGGKKSLSSIGIDPKKADPDKLISATGPLAKGWRSDAVFHSINIIGLESTGYVDLTKSGTVVSIEYFSPGRVTSAIKAMRSDSVKKFTFNSTDVNYRDIYDATNQWSSNQGTPIGGCEIKKLGPLMMAKGVSAGKESHVSYDPQFAYNGMVIYNVSSDDPKQNVRFNANTCAELK